MERGGGRGGGGGGGVGGVEVRAYKYKFLRALVLLHCFSKTKQTRKRFLFSILFAVIRG